MHNKFLCLGSHFLWLKLDQLHFALSKVYTSAYSRLRHCCCASLILRNFLQDLVVIPSRLGLSPMTNHGECFLDLRKPDKPNYGEMGDSSSHLIEHIGDLHLAKKVVEGTSKTPCMLCE